MRRTLSTTGLVIGAAWSLLMLLVLGAGIADGDAAVIVYAASASLVSAWGVWLTVRRRRRQADLDWLPVLVFTAASLLGPLAFLLLAVPRVRAMAFERVPQPEPPAVEPEPSPSLVSSVYAPGQTTAAPTVYRPASVYARPRTPPRPTLRLTWQLILAVLAFVVVGFVVAAVMGLGDTVLTPHVMRNIALGSGIVSGVAILVAAALWFDKVSRADSAGGRVPGLVMIGAATALVTGATVYFGTLTSPRNVERPSVSGPLHVNAQLTADPGRWNEPYPDLTYFIQWQSCDPSCYAIYDATGQTYVVQKADLGKRIRVAVEADARSPGWRELASGLAYSSETGPVTR